MGVTDKMWDAITTVIKMNDKVERMAAYPAAAENREPDRAGDSLGNGIGNRFGAGCQDQNVTQNRTQRLGFKSTG
ncbi:hypothetical protein [Sulfurirhabdus autotrophica]|uniref:Uncharacterized protein n=1 Tax=Sulfurirhabdus autotrophica TaxID=1706046 RepID=A0A4R3YBH9_9PROT|nr:hypothetical protein [Sulfurirhabdus autotrophica]TCV88094.1 hypothetical protein EDC63_10451 [Sulfurirhabdus autotrophica]